jgi:hypothetical protein
MKRTLPRIDGVSRRGKVVVVVVLGSEDGLSLVVGVVVDVGVPEGVVPLVVLVLGDPVGLPDWAVGVGETAGRVEGLALGPGAEELLGAAVTGVCDAASPASLSDGSKTASLPAPFEAVRMRTSSSRLLTARAVRAMTTARTAITACQGMKTPTSRTPCLPLTVRAGRASGF